MKDIFKEFKPSSWAIDNKTSIYFLTVIIALAGILAYQQRPKEQFPEVVFPQILVSTVYPGTSPTDMENLVTKQIEKRVKSIPGVKKITSNSVQNFSLVNVEFGTDANVEDSKQKVKDEVDKAQSDLPRDLPQQPTVQSIDISQMPIMNVHVSGDLDLDRLKRYAEQLKDKIEGMKEITRVDLIGALEREIQINLDMYRMSAAKVTMTDVQNAISYENMVISGGQLDMGDLKRAVSIVGEFKNVNEIGNIIIRSGGGAMVYLKDIAEIKDGFKEKESYARLDKKNVITLNIIKRSGENLIEASDKINAICKEIKETTFPKEVNIKITGDQSTRTRVTLHDLINTIIIGFILVTFILMFFMGTTNAIFVGLSVPISMCIAFMAMPLIGNMYDFKYTMNMVVLFAFLLALGIVVDDAIVVIENTHRIYDNGKMDIKKAAKMATGEVFLPVLSGTLTTLAPFFPLLFWSGVIGKFMFFMPLTVIVVLTASLFVAYIINPVFAVDFMEQHHEGDTHKKITKSFWVTVISFVVIAAIAHATHHPGIGNLTIFLLLFYLLNRFILTDIIKKFQNSVWPGVQNAYAGMMNGLLKGSRAVWLLVGLVALLFASFAITAVMSPKVVFFPSADPNFVYTYIKLPIGTSQVYTDKITQEVEKRVFSVIGENNPMVESVISNVAVGAGDPTSFDQTTSSNLGKVTVAFVEFAKRNGQSTKVYLDKIREAVKDIPGTSIVVEQEQGGPPVGKPITLEILGEDLGDLVEAADGLKSFLDKQQIAGVEELKSNLEKNKPELIISIDRERANREGVSTAQIGMALRNAVFGLDRPAKFRDNDDEYPIQIRFKEEQRNNINMLLNQKITFRDMNMGGQLREIPLSALAKVEYDNSYGGIKRKNQKRIVTLSSNVLSGYNPNQVVQQVQAAASQYKVPEGIVLNFAGEQEDQLETMNFLSGALLASILIIILILVTQFNSIGKPLIILSEILFSIIGVLLGFSFFKMDISIMMSGVGIIALAGIVVRNGILLVEFTDILREQGMGVKEAIIEAGRVRMTPVILTATAAILGLIPLAIGLNIDFEKMFSEFNPNIFFGGDSVAFWGPLSWTMIFGLSFATVLTLVFVPAMYLVGYNTKQYFGKIFKGMK